ncbi:MAG: glucose-6-phosphate isomerase [Pseudomonadota bacterium]
MKINLNFSKLSEKIIGPEFGLTHKKINNFYLLHKDKIEKFLNDQNNAKLGFYNLIKNDMDLSSIEDFALKVRGKYKNIVFFGIGGSSLGPNTLFKSLLHRYHNVINEPKIFFVDNVDPKTMYDLAGIVNPSESCYVFTSKSGTTVETISHFFAFYDLIIKVIPKDKLCEHLVFITDPQKGPMKVFATENNIPCFDIPSTVGGRFSVLCPVGLLPAALMGINIREIIVGAKNMLRLSRPDQAFINPSLTLALIISYYWIEKDISELVLMPYSDSLEYVSDWFNQLWGESLGKKFDLDGNEVNIGQTPLKALGSRDQHSQLQLYMEGPTNKLIGLISVSEYEKDFPISNKEPLFEGFDYLHEKSFTDLIKAELKATAIGLAKEKKPSFELILPRICPETIGSLFFLFEMVTAITGYILNIDPFDQPGVEVGKKYAKALLGSKKEVELFQDIDKYSNVIDEFFV